MQIDEPDETKCVQMLRGIAAPMEKHHAVLILDDALSAAVRLSHRYIPDRLLPDKAVSLLDTACARVAVGLHAIPAELDDCRRRIESLETELEIVAREKSVGQAQDDREEGVIASLNAERDREGVLDAEWQAEKAIVDEILEVRARIFGQDGAADQSQDQARLGELQDSLASQQGENPMIHPSVDYQAIASVVADWTGIPVGRMVKDEAQTVLSSR